MDKINKALFAHYFRYFLTRTLLTKKQIAHYLGCSAATINRWRKGESLPAPQQIEKVIKLLGFKTVEELNVPPPNDWNPAKIDGLTIDAWRARAIIAEQQIERLRRELNKKEN